MNAIVTVVGSDKVGIIAKVSGFLAERSVNIVDISQTILSGYFVMSMMIDASACKKPIRELKAELEAMGGDLGVSVSLMHERVFTAMHRI
jgi:ACT domain-containing protein